MRENFEITLTHATIDAGVAFNQALELQIQELEVRLDQLKALRGNVARTFGIDRKATTQMGKLLEGANRSTFEQPGKPLSLEGDIARELSAETDRALGLTPEPAAPPKVMPLSSAPKAPPLAPMPDPATKGNATG